MFKLTPEETAALRKQPESGMGYQIVDAKEMFATKRGVVYNGQLLSLDENANADRVVMLTKSVSELRQLSASSAGRFRALTVVQDDPRVIKLSTRSAKASGGAKDGPEEKTKEGEVFMRFSAFEDDIRVDKVNKCFVPMTFATTEEDAKNIKTGKDAVARYALPTSDPASYRFTAKPAKDTKIQWGIAQPAFGQPGGGVEVYFADGTQTNTVTLPPTNIDKK